VDSIKGKFVEVTENIT